MGFFSAGCILVGMVAGDVAGGQAALVLGLAPRSVLAFAERSVLSLLM